MYDCVVVFKLTGAGMIDGVSTTRLAQGVNNNNRIWSNERTTGICSTELLTNTTSILHQYYINTTINYNTNIQKEKKKDIRLIRFIKSNVSSSTDYWLYPVSMMNELLLLLPFIRLPQNYKMIWNNEKKQRGIFNLQSTDLNRFWNRRLQIINIESR